VGKPNTDERSGGATPSTDGVIQVWFLDRSVVLRPSTAQAILEHLRLPSMPLPFAPATSPPQLDFW